MKKAIIVLATIILILTGVFVALVVTDNKKSNNNSTTNEHVSTTTAATLESSESSGEDMTSENISSEDDITSASEEQTTLNQTTTQPTAPQVTTPQATTTQAPTTQKPTNGQAIEYTTPQAPTKSEQPLTVAPIDYNEPRTEAPKKEYDAVDVNNFDQIAMLDEKHAWQFITDGSIDGYNMISYYVYEPTVLRVRREHSTYITINVWQWASARSATSTDLTKVSKQIKLEVHNKLAPVLTQIFKEIYEAPDKPVLYSAGSWVPRGKGNDLKRTASAHSWGTCIDFNATSVCGGVGNTQGGKSCTLEKFKTLPECQAKYELFYDGGTVVNTFKKYGFYWGGEWSGSTNDPMHFAYLGDINGRYYGIMNYLSKR